MWQLASTSGLVNELLFPPPTAVGAALWDEFVNGTLMLDLGMSTMRVAVGFFTGAAIAILIGLLSLRHRIQLSHSHFSVAAADSSHCLRADRHPLVWSCRV